MGVVHRMDAQIRAVAPIDGVTVDPVLRTVTVQFQPAATAAQRAAAQSVVTAFDWSQAAQDAWEADQKPERKAVRSAAANATAANDTFLAISSPTNAQIAAQVRELTRQNSA